MAVSENLVNFGSRGAVSPKVTLATNERLRRRSPRTGGSRQVISSPLTRRDITSEISPTALDLARARGPDAIGHVTVLSNGQKTHSRSQESKSLHPNSRLR